LAKVTVRAGACRFTTVIEACSEDAQHVEFDVDSECPTVALVAEVLGTVDAYHEVGAGRDGEVLTTAVNTGRGCCPGCVVPSALLSVMRVAVGLAIAADSHIEFSDTSGAETSPEPLEESGEKAG